MRFPPIIDRELRVAARRRGTYWSRFGIAAMAIAVGGGIYLANARLPENKIGPAIFTGMAILAFVYALLAGRILAADCLSSEKRDGTLGLLFLTDLKGRDVVFGKLAASSLNGFLCLVAFLPILAIPLMMGGISLGQFSRLVVVLLNTFFFSLALGIFTSSISRDYRRAMAANIGLLLLITIFLPAGFLFLGHLAGLTHDALFTCYLSPILTFVLAFDDVRRMSSYPLAADFWISCGLINLLAWVFIGAASHVLPHSWQDRPVTRPASSAPAPSDAPNQRHGNRETLAAYRKRLLDVNAFYWLASRNRFKPHQVWIFMGCMGAWWIWGWISTGEWFTYPTMVGVTLLLNSTLKLWIMIESGQRLAEDKKAGAFELLLSTPLTAREILRGQLLALRRQFLKPVVVTVAVQVLFMAAAFQRKLRVDAPQALVFFACSIILLLADSLAASCLAIQLALTSRGPQRAAAGTFLRILALPWVVYALITISASFLFYILDIRLGESSLPGWFFPLGLWFACGITADLWYGLRAEWRLRTNFRALATESFTRKRAPVAE